MIFKFLSKKKKHASQQKLLGLTIFFMVLNMVWLVAQQPIDSLNNARQRGAAVRQTDTTAAPTPSLLPEKISALGDSIPATTNVSDVPKKETFFYRFFKKDYPNPRKAALLSVILPGSGQIYNRSWWKLPLAYGAIGALTVVEINNIRVHRALKTAYFNKVNDLPVAEKYQRYDATTLRRARDSARKYVEWTSLGLGIGVLLISAEAFVDAHLKQFDVSDDLSMKIRPKLMAPQPMGSEPTLGVGMCFYIRNEKK